MALQTALLLDMVSWRRPDTDLTCSYCEYQSGMKRRGDIGYRAYLLHESVYGHSVTSQRCLNVATYVGRGWVLCWISQHAQLLAIRRS